MSPAPEGSARRAVGPPLAARLAAVAILAILLGGAFEVLSIRAARRGEFPDYSGHSSSPAGLRAFVLFAREEGIDLRFLTRRLAALPDERGAALVLVRPGSGGRAVDAEEARSIEAWVRAGNLVVLADDRASAISRQLGFELVAGGAPDRRWRAADAALPIAREAPEVLGSGAAWIEPGRRRRDAIPLYTASEQVKAAYVALGEGDLLVLADPYPLTNAGLAESPESPNPALAAALVGLLAGRTVYLDEYHHGFERRATLATWLEEIGLGPFVLQLAVLAVLAILAGRRRLGPPIRSEGDGRREWSEHAAARALLHAKSRHHAWCLETLASRLATAGGAGPGDPIAEARRALEADLARATRARRISNRRLVARAERIDRMERELEACRRE